jgi:uncharacterized protein YjbI with pentapeptide repeats
VNGLEGIRFNRATLTNVQFKTGFLRCAKFGACKEMVKTTFVDLRLIDCDFTGASASQCDFTGATFEGQKTRLWKTKLQDCILFGAVFDRVDMFEADLTRADLREATGYQFDDNQARSVILSPDAVDHWSVLRRAYTGSRFVFNLLFLVIFFAPLGFKALFWTQVAHLERSITEAESELRQAAELLIAHNSPGLREVGTILHRVSSRGACLAERCETVSLLRLLLGLKVDLRNKSLWEQSLIMFAAAAGPLLILYNIGRATLTFFVTPLRDEEDRSGQTPRWKWSDPRKSRSHTAPASGSAFGGLKQQGIELWDKIRRRYEWMVKLHRLIQVLAYVAYASTAVTIVRFLWTSVALPE